MEGIRYLRPHLFAHVRQLIYPRRGQGLPWMGAYQGIFTRIVWQLMIMQPAVRMIVWKRVCERKTAIPANK